MNDFQALEWVKQPTDGTTAQSLRRDVRKHRRERGRGGHRFSMNYLKTVWSASDGEHVVLNHVDDSAWQMWYRHPVDDWMLISWHGTRREAQAAAESRHPEIAEKLVASVPGTYVLARWPGSKDYPIRVHCSTPKTTDDILEVLTRLGCETRSELVTASLG